MKTDIFFIGYSTWDYNKKCVSLEKTISRSQYSQLIIRVILRFSPLVLSLLIFIPFPCRETLLFTRQVKIESREEYFNHNNYKGNMPTLAWIKQLSIHFFLYRPLLFHLSTENLRVWSVGNGYHSAYSRADTINNHINKWSKRFFLRRKYWKCTRIK